MDYRPLTYKTGTKKSPPQPSRPDSSGITEAKPTSQKDLQ